MSNKRRILNVLLGVLICVAVYQLAQHEFLPKDERIRREQLITDFVDAAFEGAWDGNERVSLHKWEQDEIPLYFTEYVLRFSSKDHNVNFRIGEQIAPNDVLERLESDLSYFYTHVYQIAQEELPHFEKVTGKKLMIYPFNPDLWRKGAAYFDVIGGAIWLGPSILRPNSAPLFGYYPNIIYFYNDERKLRDLNKGLLSVEKDGGIEYALCNFWPVDDIRDDLRTHVRNCLVRALGLPRGVGEEEIRWPSLSAFIVDKDATPYRNPSQSTPEDLLRILYCPDLKNGMSERKVRKVLRRRNSCFDFLKEIKE